MIIAIFFSKIAIENIPCPGNGFYTDKIHFLIRITKLETK